MFQIPKKRSRIVQGITPFHDWLPSRAITALFKMFFVGCHFSFGKLLFQKQPIKKLHRYWMCTAPRYASENQWCRATNDGHSSTNHGEISHHFCPSTHHEHIRWNGWLQILDSMLRLRPEPCSSGRRLHL